MSNSARNDSAGSFVLPAPIDEVFPLFDPVNESKWIHDWKIEPVYPAPFRVEPDAVFRTRRAGHEATWTLLRHDVNAHEVEYLVVEQGEQVRRIRVACEGLPLERTRVTVSYRVTALSDSGRTRLEAYDEAFIRSWEPLLERYFASRSGRSESVTGPAA